MAKVALGARYVLGLMFFVFGLNGFFNFIPMQAMPEAATAFLGGLGASGYFFPFLKATEVVCGALLLANVFSPLALVILAPISLQILLFHTILAPEGMIMAIVIVAIHVFLGITNLDKYRPMFGKI